MENNIGGNFRSANDPFTMVCNTVIEDKSLSMKAKGLYLIIKHYITLPNFILNKGYLMSLSKEGERAFDSTWKELKDAGYLKQYRLKGNGGKWVYEYELLNLPQTEEAKEIKQNKKPSTSAKVNGYNDKVKSSKSSNKSICKSTPNYTPIPKESIQENNTSEVVQMLKEKGFKNINEKQANETFTDISKLRKCIERVGNIKQYKYLHTTYTDFKEASAKPKDIPTVKTRYHNINESFSKYSPEQLEKILLESQKDKFK